MPTMLLAMSSPQVGHKLWQPWLANDEARTYSCKELPSAKWRKERREHMHSGGLSDGPLDFSNHTTSRAPPSYDQSIRYKHNNSSRPSVIQSVVQSAPPLPSPPLEDVCDPAIDEHFRRSLGKEYSSIFSPVKAVAQTKSTDSDLTGLSVDDHFAKALGETWTKLKEQESLERNKTNQVTPAADPVALKKKNKDSGMLNDKRRAGARVWIPHGSLVWEPAEVALDYVAGTLTVEFGDGRKVELKVTTDSELPPLRNPEILLGENDLTALSYLHEPAVLHNLNHRFCVLSTIYTYCGIVLVAINPYDELQIYDNDTIWTYRGKSQGDLDPHIFAVAEEAYTRLERESKDQSIIVSGESGAGKTVSAKYVMRYFATVGGSSQETQVEKKVLSSSPIMEAIGNAKTTRNDNSSRFGKFIEIKFNKSYHIVGASMRTYLLEKSRVVFQAEGERNYHIFYQLCAAKDKYPHLKLSHQDDFAFLNQGGSPYVDGVNDLESFDETLQALNTLGFAWRDQENMFKILGSILHLGNVKLQKNDEGSAIKKDDKHLVSLAELLEVEAAEMRHWLCNRQIVSTKEVFNKPMSTTEASAAREALSKHMYSQLFSWIVSVVNEALEKTTEGVEHRFIGVLDIYGFETFEINSFEQFCINYANEKLQQQFNQHVFKLEQEEYLKEGIEWKFIDFYDNQPCIDLIESKLGILDLLDEECRMPNGSDNSWAEKLYKTCVKYKHFGKPRFGNSSFIIHHFADNVEYQADGFLDKNRDSVVEEQIGVLKNSKNKFIGKLFADERGRQLSIPTPQTRVKVVPAGRGGGGGPAKQNKKTVGSQFRDSLNLLMNTLNATTPHYVRCIKPNDEKKAFAYNPQRAVQQLRACGVLETIRISAAGFPSRWLYRDFFLRYRVLCMFKDINRNDMKITCEKILEKHIQDVDKYQFGKTKIFFRAGQVAFLEKLRADKLRACCIMIQKNIRSFIVKKKFKKIMKSLQLLQRYSRGLIARRKARFLRQTKAATTIQRRMRGWVKRQQYQRVRRAVLGIQTHIRGMLARRRFLEMRYNHSAIVIQRFVRGFLARRRYGKNQHSVVICQSAVRRFLARRRLRALKKEARSVEHVKKLNKGLENKIISMQQKIGDMTKSMNLLKGLEPEVNDLRSKLETLRSVESENKKIESALKERDNALRELQAKLQQEEAEKMDLLTEKMSNADQLRVMEEKYNELKKELDRVNLLLSNSQSGFEEKLQARLVQERALLQREHEMDLENYQKLLKDYSALEVRHENMERQMAQSGGKHTRNPSDTSTLSSHTSNEMENEDVGYASTRSNTPRSQDIEEQDRSMSEMSYQQMPEIDVGLMLKLQQKLKEVEKERDRLFEQIESLERDDSPTEDKQNTIDKLKLEELEIENEKIKRNLEVLRDSLATGDPGTKELLNQFRASEWELDRRRDEIIQLRAVLATQAKGLKNIARINYGSTSDVNMDVINEDGELVVAYEAQKQITRQLEDELQYEKDRRKIEITEYRSELDRLKEDNERQQKLLAGNLNKTPQSQTEAYMKHEISRLATENLHLQEKLDKIQEVARTLKRQNKFLLKQLKDSGVKIESLSAANDPSGKTSGTWDSAAPNVVMKKERNYQGMFEYRREDEQRIIQSLILELKPRTAMHLLPGLPAYIIFMCVRHIDFVNDEEKVRSLFSAFINAVKKLVKKKSNDFEITILWLSNTLRLLHNLKQYSGDKIFQVENTVKQNEQCLRNFDLCQYRQVFSDIAVWIYQGVIRNLQEALQPLVVPALLENEAIAGLERGMGRHRSTSLSSVADPEKENKRQLEQLLNILTTFHRALILFGVDTEVIIQIFRQTYYFICASSLNNLLLRKDLCRWSKGMQIRYNLSHLEQWARDKKLSDSNVNKTLDSQLDPLLQLEPIIQASQLLQARKLDEDIKSLCEMCDALTPQRIVKLLNLYTPCDEYEERVPAPFLRNIQLELQKRRKDDSSSLADQQGQLMMDSKMMYPVRFPFTPSKIRLEEVEIPDCLELPMLKKV